MRLLSNFVELPLNGGGRGGETPSRWLVGGNTNIYCLQFYKEFKIIINAHRTQSINPIRQPIYGQNRASKHLNNKFLI